MQPWPRARIMKRQSPDIAVVGRTWINLRHDRLSYLIGNILHDLADEYPVILTAVSYSVSEMDSLSALMRCL